MKTRIMWVTMKEGRSEHTSARAMNGSIEDKPDKIMMYTEIISSTYTLDQKYKRRPVRFRRRHGDDDDDDERRFLLESFIPRNDCIPMFCIEGDVDMSSVCWTIRRVKRAVDWRLLL